MTAGGKVLRFALAPLAAVSTRKGRLVVRLDPGFKGDLVVGVEATDGSENLCLATQAARVLIFPVTEANIVAGAARGVTAIRLDSKDRVLGFVLANKKREGLTVRTNRGAIQIVRATKYPVTGRGGKGYAILQRGSLDSVVPAEAEPIRAWRNWRCRPDGTDAMPTSCTGANGVENGTQSDCEADRIDAGARDGWPGRFVVAQESRLLTVITDQE